MSTSVVLFLGMVTASQVDGQAVTKKQKAATIAWVQSLQKANGGFAGDAKPDTPATMSATATALRALHYLAGQPKNSEACAKFVMSCFDKELGGFAPMPKSKADKQATAYGLMAAALLNLPAESYQVRPVIYLCSCVKKLEDIQLTAAAYEVSQSKCELAQDWIVMIQDTQKPDGAFGKEFQPGTTAAAVVTLRRLGGQVKKMEQVRKSLIASQLADGGWGKGRDSDLESTCRVLEALVALKEGPDPKAGAFVVRCRNDDGGYGLRPGEASSLQATFFAAVLHRLNAKK